MDNDMLNNISGTRFGAVWDRVSDRGGNAPVSKESYSKRCAELLCDITDNLSGTYRELCCLAKRCRGSTRAELLVLARSCRSGIRELRVQYYILTGRSYSPRSFIDPSKNTSDMLRDIIARESCDSGLLDKLANETDSRSLARVALCESKECLRRACEEERLLARCMC